MQEAISEKKCWNSEKAAQERKDFLLARLLAERTNARMAVLETQSCNFKAISFYKKHGFEIIGFDLFAYSNDAIEKHNIRIEMGKKLEKRASL